MTAARVTYFINSFEQGGAERQLWELVRGLDRTRFTPSLIVCSEKGERPTDLEEVPTISLRAPGFPSPWGLARLVDAMRAQRPDLVHTVKGHENAFGRWAARRAGVQRVVSAVRCPSLPWTERVTEAATWSDADRVVVNSVGIQSAMVRDLGVSADSMTVIENGVDSMRFRPRSSAERAALRAERGLSRGPVVLVSGRVSPEKSQLEIIDALGALRRDGTLPAGTTVLFAGRDSLLLYGRRVRARARALGLLEHTRFLGVVRDIDALLAAADVLLLPSRYEGLPNAVVEAMATGVAAVVSDAANADALVTDGVEGFVTGAHTPEAIATGLRRALACDAETLAAMGARGRAHVERRFAMRRMVERTEALYTDVLGRS